jgi:4-diphosphocytidyl-2-C-methyl-D-erythritol kinase
MSSVKLLSPAKINLTLEILGTRTDGYHELRSIIQPIDLFDEVKIESQEGQGIQLDSSCIPIPLDKDNLAWKAAALFLEKSGQELQVEISIKKRIPLGAGLGGGSSNAASVMIGLNRLTDAFSEQELLKLALNLGADVPFFIRSQTAVIEGIGEKINPLRNFPLFYYVILFPNINTSTEMVYKKWDELNNKDHVQDESINEQIRKFSNRNEALPLINDLENPAIALHPEIKAYKQIFKSLGLESVLMTGSGSAVYAAFRSQEEAYEIYEYLNTSPTFQVFLASGIKGWHRLI